MAIFDVHSMLALIKIKKKKSRVKTDWQINYMTEEWLLTIENIRFSSFSTVICEQYML